MNHLYDKDRRVKVLVDGIPVVNSPLQSQYSKFLNFSSTDFLATVNPLGYYDLVLKKNADKVIVKKDGATVGTGAAQYPNFVNDFNVSEVLGTNTYNITIKYPGRVLTQVAGVAVNATQPRKLNFVTGLTATENTGNDTIDVVGSSFTLNPNDTAWKNQGYFSGSSGGTNSSGGALAGDLMMNNWQAFNKMDAKFDLVEGPYLDWTTGSTSTNFVEYSSDANATTFIRKFNPNFWMKIRIPDISSNRMYLGFTDTLPLPNNAFNFLNNKNGFGLRFDTGQDTNWMMMFNTGIATNPAPTDTGVPVVANTIYLINIYADETNSRWGVTINGSTPLFVTTTGPAQTTPLGFSMKYTTQTGSAKHMHFWYLYGKSDK